MMKLAQMLQKLRYRMIDDLHLAWRFWSVRFASLGITLQSVMLAAPSAIPQLWAEMPAEARAMLPLGLVNAMPLVLFGLSLVSRFVKQGSLTR